MTLKRLLIVAFTIFAISSTGLLASTSTSTSTSPSISTAAARSTQGRPVIGRVGVGGPVSYQVGWGFWGGYGPYYGGWWGPWGGPWGPYGGYYGGYYYSGGSMQIQVKPKETEVYVDGYRAGIVNDYDSWYQSLNLEPGGHEIVLYLEGYRTQRHQVYFTQYSSQHLKGTMEKLEAGESSGPRPQPSPRSSSSSNNQQPRGPRGPRPDRPQSDQYVQAAQSDPAAAPQQAERFGTLSIKVQPADATILVDNHSWQTVGSDQAMSIKLGPGRHHVEVSKDGFASYVEDVLIRTDATMTLNVGLTRKQ